MITYSPLPEKCNIGDSLPFIIIFIIVELYLYLRPVRFLPARIARLVCFYDAIGFAVLGAITIFFRGEGNEFIYFQF